MKKRFLAVFLALALCLGLAPTAFAAEETIYYLKLNAVTTAENSEISISGEGLVLTERIYCERGLVAGQDAPGKGDDSSYPVFTASKPVTVTITADYTDWGEPTGTWIEGPDEYFWDWYSKLYVVDARVFDFSGTSEFGYPESALKDLAYFDGTYAVRLENGTVKENAGKLKDIYMNNGDGFGWGNKYIYPGATVTLSEPGDYLISVDIVSRWSSQMNYAVIHIVPNGTFTDVPTGAYYAGAVEWAVDKNITTGKTAVTFAPDETCTHGQILTFLWRAAGSPASGAQPPIALKGNEYYAGAVRWAAEKGMIGAGFDPSAPCNRAYAVLYIWQAFGKPAASSASPFTDVPAHWSSGPAVFGLFDREDAARNACARLREGWQDVFLCETV